MSNWPVANLGFQVDYTITSPLNYTHRLPTLTFETNGFNLGHFMMDNADVLSLAAWWKPAAQWTARARFEYLRKGEEFPYRLGDPIPVDQKPFLENIIWQSQNLELSLAFSPYSNFSVFAQFNFYNTKAEEETQVALRPNFEQAGRSLYGYIGLQYGFQ